MTGIAIDFVALEAAFESHAPGVRSFLHRKNGAIETYDPASRGLPSAEWLEIEPVPSREQYRMMERFIETVTHLPLKERLQDSIVGKGAFRRFKDVVSRFPEERKRWFSFRDVLLHRHILEWLKTHRVTLDEVPAWGLELPMTPSPDAGHEAGVSEEGAPAVDEKVEVEELRSFVLSWARAHGEEYRYLFGPAAFERLAQDITQEFAIARRRSEK
ncbi:MAG: hypothetical protein IT383_04160 [Deltaproteobacteria bacterium]|nr:hypothetical protein [Deltaproteobacteria bacterium]